MKLKQYQVDAFAERVFEGNPAAVCPLDHWLDDGLLQAIANENNLSETAFFVPAEKGFQLRWFTPVAEVNLCGHATLASAHVLFDILGYSGKQIIFQTMSGELVVEAKDGLLTMDFPARPPVAKPIPDALVAGLGRMPQEVWAANDYMAVFEDEEAVRTIAACFRETSGAGSAWRDRDRSGEGRQLRKPLLRATDRHTRGSGNRFCPLRADALLGTAARQAFL